MAVIVKYVIERNGVEKMTFTAKTEADAYDRMLDMADDLFSLLADSRLITDEQQQESLALYLAKHKEEVLQALGAKAKVSKKEKITAEASPEATDSSSSAETNSTAELSLVSSAA